jgi:hypothetical protein
MKLPELYAHKMTHDAGIAPSVRNGILIQAICIKNTRGNAEPGDWICGISGEEVPGDWNRLIYFAKVERVLPGTDYYLEPEFQDRLDSIYRSHKSGRAFHLGSAYANYPNTPTANDPKAKNHFRSDIGSTGLLADAQIIYSRTFVYLGAEGRSDYMTGDLPRWILGDPATKTKPWGMAHKRLLRDAVLYPGAYEILSNYREKMIAEFGLGHVGEPSDLSTYLRYLAARGISRRVYEGP